MVAGIVFGLAVAVSGGVAVASAVESNGAVIHACVEHYSGRLRIVGSHDAHCARNESPLSWNQRGPTGPPGPIANGIQGTPLHFEVDVPNVPAQSCISVPLDIPGRAASDHVVVNPTGNLPLGIDVTGIFDINDAASESVTEIRACNVTTTDIDPPAGDWGFVLFRDETQPTTPSSTVVPVNEPG